MKTTKYQYEIFCEEVKYWQKYFGLINWRIDLAHEKINDKAGAQCTYWYDARILEISLNTTCNRKLTDLEVRSYAFHEICEGMLCELRGMSEGYHNPDEVGRKVHEVIQILQNTIFDKRHTS